MILTGTFDNWSGSLPLVKTSTGDFSITLPLKQEGDDDKVLFKFIVDGNWTTSEDYESFEDGGNVNNVLYLKNLGEVDNKTSSSKIPEAGGLAAASIPIAGAAGATAVASGTTTTSKDEKDYKPTVLPSNEGNHASIAGEPGVHVPSNPHEISAFNEVSDVNAKDLNAKLNKENEEPELKTQVLPSSEGKHSNIAGEPGVVIPNNGFETKEFNETSNVDAKELNEKLDSEEGTAVSSNDSPSKKTKQVQVKKLIRRNKKTGEEIVVSSEPVEGAATTESKSEEKTLDPKKSTSATNGKTETKEPVTTDSKPKSSTTATTATATKPKPKPAVKQAEKKEEEKKKRSVFSKFKKIFD